MWRFYLSMRKEVTANNSSYYFEIVKAVIISVIISLILILVAAFAIKIFSIESSIIPIINQVIKGISILLSALVCLKLPNNGWLRGIILGVLYIIFAFIIFSLLDGEFKIGLCLLNDIALGAISGLISGIIAVNIRN